MPSPVPTLFAAGGVVIEAGSNRPFLLNGQASFWLIESGTVDLFAVPLLQGEPAGARTHLFRASAEQALFGLDSNASIPIGFLAVGGVGTRLRQFSLSELKAWGRDPVTAGAVADRIEQWIQALYGGLSRGMLPKEFSVLEAGRETPLGVGAAARPVDGVVWIQQLQGSAHLAGVAELSLPKNGHCIPLTSSGWLQAAEDSVVLGFDTVTLLRQGEVWSCLESFYPLMMRWAGGNAAQVRVAEGVRLKAKANAGRRAMAGAVAMLSASLQKDGAESAPLQVEGDPLLAACQLIGRALGFPFRTPAGYRTGPEEKDPLTKLAASSRLRLRRVVLAENWWSQDNGPLLGYLKENNQPVALLPTSTHAYELADPIARTRQTISMDLAQSLKPLAFTFYRSLPNRALNVWDVVKFGLQGTRKDIITVLLIGLGGGLLGLLTPIATGVIFDTIIPGAERRQLLHLTLGLWIAALASVMFEITWSVAMLRIETRSDASVQGAVWDRLLGLPLPFFRNYTAGDLAMRANGINAIRQILSGAVLTTVLAGLFSLFNFALLFYYSLKLALLSTGLVLISLGAVVVISFFRLKYQRPIFKIQGKIAGMVLQFITGISKLRVAGAEALAYSVWARAFSEEKKLDLKTGTVLISLNVFNTAFSIATTIILFGAMAFWVDQKMSTGMFLAFNAAFGGFLGAVLAVGHSLISLLDAVPIYERAKPILDTLPEVDEARADPGELHGRIELTHVLFRYKTDTPLVLDDLSFQINEGEFVAIVGPSGSGKSTMIRLLLGFERPESGTVHLDGLDLAGLDVSAVRRQFGVVLQSGRLIPGNILDNIVGSSLLSLEDAWEAAKKAGLDEDIRNMPMGMHTVLSEGAGTLSGGQRQRLMIARAIVSSPRILLFDEATSALDNRTQAIVSRSLEQLQATRIVIAHRLSTIMSADRILVIQGGRLVQSGSYRELVSQPGMFAELAKRQMA